MNTLIEELKRLSTEATDGPWMSGDRGVYTANAVLILKAVGSAKPADMDLVECFRNNLPAIIARLEAAEGMRVALEKIQSMDYRRAAVNGCAYADTGFTLDEVGFAKAVPDRLLRARLASYLMQIGWKHAISTVIQEIGKDV